MTDAHDNPIKVSDVVAVHYRVKRLNEGNGGVYVSALDAAGNEVGSKWWKSARLIRPVAEARGAGRPNDGMGGESC